MDLVGIELEPFCGRDPERKESGEPAGEILSERSARVEGPFQQNACTSKIDRREIGGPGRDRTDDLFHAMEARSQLRHRPTV